ncbi:MAG: Preprotein translocase, SecG subunit [Candidatus Yanofskybacteria bacterium GW2011_GWA1_48_10]|uniref:Protein-export membrane protein SecG n=1 Tax=Candidatus Yanofskybacteria bacterium GW2011_GWA1_48_10 TaxID=1619022 RepID=A0A0G1U579_9BACT|nr:MAG: Preprotein translocase, SecG subunit [Candidatus Yanofskybacteria bacterium GW2011_GWA1_48_10]
MAQILPYIQIILSLLLIAGVLLQRSEASLGSAFGGDGAMGGRFMRRGLEKILFNATLVVAVLFALSAFASLLLLGK